MRKLTYGSITLAALIAGPALAADLPVHAPIYRGPPPVVAYSWSGFYMGINGGAVWGHKCWTFLGSVAGGPIPAVSEGCHSPTGGIFGGQAGFNWQVGALVFGVEAQGDFGEVKAQNVSLAFPTITNRTRMNGFGLVTGRVGYAWNMALLYVKGGAAVVRDSYNSFLTASLSATGIASETHWGGTVGGGFELAFGQNFSAAIEYDYIDFGTKQITFVSPTNTIDNIKQDVHMLTARFNYRLNSGPIVARY
jgi:outer membrane immunogenic protein